MKTVQKTYYQCEHCNAQYPTAESALSCEAHPVTQDKGVMIGDLVRITAGQGRGQLGEVTKVQVLSKDFGHHMADRYWHTIALEVDCVESWGNRFLTFDAYETIR